MAIAFSSYSCVTYRLLRDIHGVSDSIAVHGAAKYTGS